MKIITRGRAMAALLIALGLFASAGTALAQANQDPTSYYPYDGITAEDCTVKSRFWYPARGSDLSLSTAIQLANSTDPRMQLCQGRIILNVDRISLRQPLFITSHAGTKMPSTQGTGSNDQWSTWTGNWFEILPNQGREEVVLDASSIDSWGSHECAVIIDTNSVKLTRIKVMGVEEGKHAVCVNGSYSLMDSVKVLDASGDAFVFGPTAKNNIIMPNVAVGDFEGKGLRIDNPSESNGNRFIPTSMTIGETDENGISALGPAICSIDELLAGGRNCASAGAGDFFNVSAFEPENFIVSKVPAVVQLFSIRSGATNDVIEVGGAIVKWDKPLPTTPNDTEFCSAMPVKKVMDLQVYTVNNYVNGFYGYVTETKEATGYGLTKDGEDTNGTFYFNVPKDKGQIVIVPELTGHTLGQTSQLINIADCGESGTGCEEVLCPNGNTNAGGLGGGFNNLGQRFISVQHCRAVRNLNNRPQGSKGLRARGYDTDGDALLDDWEDTDRDCECDANETCWYYADTDFDGIADGSGQEKACETIELDDTSDDYGECTGVGIYDPDGDGKPNALDSDSDGDGRPDYKEDRNDAVVFTAGNEPSSGVLYAYKQNSLNPLKVNNQVKECPLGVGREEGVAYLWYRVTRDGSGVITAIDDASVSTDIPSAGQPAEGQPQPAAGVTSPEILICRIQSLAWPHNFNGEYNAENNETNPYKDITVGATTIKAVDTDDDTWCDGDGSGGKCAGLAHMSDKCPTVKAKPGSTDGCGVEFPCLDKQVFYTTDPDYVDKDDLGLPIGLTHSTVAGSEDFAIFELKTAAGKPDYLKISRLCGDTDKDGIPDCVENPYGGCADEETGLKYNNPDSDGDGYQDGVGIGNQVDEDVCPGNAGPGIDAFVDSASHGYSCGSKVEAMLIYRERPILSCFFDRDADGLRDCEEDVNQDGDFTKQQNFAGIAGIDDAMMDTLETDPLDPDSDDEGLSDKEERKNVVKVLEDGRNIHTNPMAKDTDGDTINDDKEDRDGDHMFVITPIQGTEGCTGFQFLDTDPTSDDTDGDTLKDNIELDGDLYIGDVFVNMILDQSVWGQGGGINLVSNPRAADSDGDTVPDNEEYDGVVGYSESNPCMQDSDGDTIVDSQEIDGCALNKDPNCDGTATMGIDQDSDGLPDGNEAKLGTDPKNPDTDGDGVKDGTEDTNHNGIYEPNLGETNPLTPDTDGDGLSDGMELRYGTDGATADTDGDCILDGLEDANRNGKYEASETNALDADTDEDGLPDGLIRGIGEDLNCDGVRGVDAGGNFTETDPVNPDSDFDGNSDYDEMMDGGWNPAANISKATRERGGGCSMVSSAAPSSMISLLGMLIAATGVLIGKRRMEKKTPA